MMNRMQQAGSGVTYKDFEGQGWVYLELACGNLHLRVHE